MKYDWNLNHVSTVLTFEKFTCGSTNFSTKPFSKDDIGIERHFIRIYEMNIALSDNVKENNS